MQKYLKSLEKWCNSNGIFINVQKTKFMIFGSKVTLAEPEVNQIKLSISKQVLATQLLLPGCNFR